VIEGLQVVIVRPDAWISHEIPAFTAAAAFDRSTFSRPQSRFAGRTSGNCDDVALGLNS
jgi:hypothetical protein